MEYQKWSHLNYHNGFEFGNLKTRGRFIKLADFNKIAQELGSPVLVREFLSILDDFQIFAEVPYFLVKFDEKYASEVDMPVWPIILDIMPSSV